MGASSRPTWDQYFLGMAIAASARGDCRRTQVGAVLVNGSPPRIVGTGYNGVSPGAPGCIDGACPRGLMSFDELPTGTRDTPYDACIAFHAELNAIQFAPTDQWLKSTLYVTRNPCRECIKTAIDVGAERAVWLTDLSGDEYQEEFL